MLIQTRKRIARLHPSNRLLHPIAHVGCASEGRDAKSMIEEEIFLMTCTSSMYILFLWDEQVGPSALLNWTATAPFGGVADEAKKRPSFGGKPFWVSLGSFRPYAVPPQLLNFRVKKPENIVKFGGSTYEQNLSVLRKIFPAFSFPKKKKSAWGFFFPRKKIFYFFLQKFFENFEKNAKKPKKSTFLENAKLREFRVSGAVFLWKGGTLSIYLGGGVTPIFRSILRIGTPFFGGLFLTLFFEFFLEKKIFSGQKIFFVMKKK